MLRAVSFILLLGFTNKCAIYLYCTFIFLCAGLDWTAIGASLGSVIGCSSTKMPKKDDQKDTSKTSQVPISGDAILAAIANHGAELSKITSLVDGLKKSLEGRLDAIETTLSSLQKKHHEAERRFGELDGAMLANGSRLASLEAKCDELHVANGLLRAKVNDLEGRSRRLNIRIMGI